MRFPHARPYLLLNATRPTSTPVPIKATWLQDGLDSGKITLVPDAKASRFVPSQTFLVIVLRFWLFLHPSRLHVVMQARGGADVALNTRADV